MVRAAGRLNRLFLALNRLTLALNRLVLRKKGPFGLLGGGEPLTSPRTLSLCSLGFTLGKEAVQSGSIRFNAG